MCVIVDIPTNFSPLHSTLSLSPQPPNPGHQPSVSWAQALVSGSMGLGPGSATHRLQLCDPGKSLTPYALLFLL